MLPCVCRRRAAENKVQSKYIVYVYVHVSALFVVSYRLSNTENSKHVTKHYLYVGSKINMEVMSHIFWYESNFHSRCSCKYSNKAKF
jgi:hypothetical protein